MRWLFILTLFSCDMNPAIITNNIGNADSGAPGWILTTAAPDPVFDSAFLCIATATKGPLTGALSSADFDVITNCTLTSFTQISHNVWSYLCNPIIDGTVSMRIGAATCTWTSNTGIAISNTASNTLSKTYDSGASYNLEDAQEISVSQHYRGHGFSIGHSNDLASVVSVPGLELLFSKYNFGATMFANGDSQASRDMYDFGRLDFGVYPNGSLSDYLVREPLVQAIMDGQLPTVVGYKNGVDSYWADLIPYILVARNADYSGPTNSATPPSYNFYQYTSGLTQQQLLQRELTYRPEYAQKLTTTSYYITHTETMDANLAAFISYVSGQSGRFHSFFHWHWQVGNYPKHYLQQLITDIGATDPYRGPIRVIEEYYYVRESVDSVSGSGNTITVNHSETYSGAPYSRITTPLWIKVNLTGTVFAGQDIALSNGLRPRSMGSNVYYIPVVLDYSGSSTTVQVGIATTVDYVNLTAPVPSRTGSAVTCDQSVKYTIWKVAKPTSLTTSVTSATIPTADNTTINLTVATGLSIAAKTEVRVKYNGSNYFYAWVTSYDSGTGALVLSSFPDAVGSGTYSSWTIDRYYHELAATIVERSFTYATSYTIQATLDETNYTYYVGVINRDGISATDL